MLNATGTYAVNAGSGFTADYGANGDPALVDPWGNAIILQRSTLDPSNTYIRLISAGANKTIDTPQDYLGHSLPAPKRTRR